MRHEAAARELDVRQVAAQWQAAGIGRYARPAKREEPLGDVRTRGGGLERQLAGDSVDGLARLDGSWVRRKFGHLVERH
jgi:hypothetical protein